MTAPAGAATLAPVRYQPAIAAAKRDRPAPLITADFRSIDRSTPSPGEQLPNAATLATADALSITGANRSPGLSIQPFAGHRAFDTVARLGMAHDGRMIASNNVLGVGLTGGWGISVARNVTAAALVSVDYDRIDTTRFVNLHSTNPYSSDDADTGLTATAGAQLAWRFGEGRRFRLGAFAAVVQATGANRLGREQASVGARIVNSLGESRLQPLYADTGASLSYAVAARVRIDGALLETINPAYGNATAANIALRIAY